MLFTVIRYLPILEEETQAHSVELSKDVSQDNSGDDNTNDDDPENEKTDLHLAHCFESVHTIQIDNNFRIKHQNYLHPVEKIHTPPPQI